MNIPEKKIHVLFVCLGNICRSPVAQASFDHWVEKQNVSHLFLSDSCGTSNYHIGNPPHRDAIRVAKERNLDKIETLRARQISEEDFETFHYIFAMDKHNYSDLLYLFPQGSKAQIIMYRKFDPHIQNIDKPPCMPDPFYGNKQNFYLVQNIALNTSKNILSFLLKEHFNQS